MTEDSTRTSRYSDTSSIFTSTGTFTSSSTIPGIGALSGKAIKRLGSAVVNGVDAIIIRRRLAQLESALGQRADDASSGDYIKSLYSDLLELSRPVYSLSIRTRAFRLIMGRIGAVDFENLAAAVVNWPLSEAYNLLKSMFSCFRSDGDPSDPDIRAMRIREYHAAGLDSYTSRLPYQSEDIPQSILCLAFVTFLAHTISLNFRPSLATLLVELDLVGFIKETYPTIQEIHSRRQRQLRSVRLLVLTLLNSLSRQLSIDQDLIALTHLNELLALPALAKAQTPISPSFDISAQKSLQGLPSPTEQTLSQEDLITAIREQTSSLRDFRSPYFRRNRPNILLLGAGETGKTTLMKQIIGTTRSHGYSDSERAAYIEYILSNVWSSLRRAVDYAALHASDLEQRSYFSHASFFLELEQKAVDDAASHASNPRDRFYFDQTRLTPGTEITFRPSDLQYVLNEYRKVALLKGQIRDENTDYYLSSLSRMSAPDYLPSDEDILRCYVMTTGIHSGGVNLGGDDLCFHDFGGQRSERKKWIHRFEHAGMVIFVAALSDYDEVLFEDSSVNRMQESLTLFDSICNSKWFSSVPMILFLNKTDVFAEKLPHSPLSDYFPDYKGGDDFNAARDYIVSRFVSLNERATDDIRVYLTNAIDTEQIKSIMNDIHESFLQPDPRPLHVQVSVSTQYHDASPL